MYEWLRRWAESGPEQTHSEPIAASTGYGNAANLEDIGLATSAGDVAEAARRAVAPDVVYLGINDAVTDEEVAALPAWAAVCDGSDKQGTVKSVDGKRDLSLEKPEDIERFLDDAGVSTPRTKPDGSTESKEEVAERMKALQGVMMGAGTNSRDQLAEFVQTVQRVERGEIDMERLVLSGHHHTGEGFIYGNGSVSYAQLKGIMEQFPEARSGVKDLMLSACNTVKGGAHDDIYRDIFPNLESAWGYNGIAPSIGADPKNTSPKHIEAWDAASRGDDPSAVVAASKDKLNAKVAVY